jgi:hypothetical protein
MWSLFVALSITTISYYSQYYNAECHISFIVMLSVMFEAPYLSENVKKFSSSPNRPKHGQKWPKMAKIATFGPILSH